MEKNITTFDELNAIVASKENGTFMLTVTPELAGKILRAYGRNSGTINQNAVKRYAEVMRARRWISGYYAPPISFGSDRRIVNGQVRLYAVMLSRATVDFNLEINSPVLIRQCKDNSGVPPKHKISHRFWSLRVSLCSYLAHKKLNAVETETFYEKHKMAIESVMAYFPRYRRGISTGVVLGELVKIYYHMDAKKFCRFARVLNEGNLNEHGEVPILLLRNKLLCPDEFVGEGRSKRIAGYIQAAFYAADHGKTPQRLILPENDYYELPENAGDEDNE